MISDVRECLGCYNLLADSNKDYCVKCAVRHGSFRPEETAKMFGIRVSVQFKTALTVIFFYLCPVTLMNVWGLGTDTVVNNFGVFLPIFFTMELVTTAILFERTLDYFYKKLREDFRRKYSE